MISHCCILWNAVTSPEALLNGNSVKILLYKSPSHNIHCIGWLGENIGGLGYWVSQKSRVCHSNIICMVADSSHLVSAFPRTLAFWARMRVCENNQREREKYIEQMTSALSDSKLCTQGIFYINICTALIFHLMYYIFFTTCYQYYWKLHSWYLSFFIIVVFSLFTSDLVKNVIKIRETLTFSLFQRLQIIESSAQLIACNCVSFCY